MALTIVRPADRDIRPVGDAVPNAPAETRARSSRQVVSAADPYVQFTRLQAGTPVAAHSHAAPEAMVILSGSARIGDVDCEPGTLVIVPANEEYGFDAGPDEDLTFVVVRPVSGGFSPGTH